VAVRFCYFEVMMQRMMDRLVISGHRFCIIGVTDACGFVDFGKVKRANARFLLGLGVIVCGGILGGAGALTNVAIIDLYAVAV